MSQLQLNASELGKTLLGRMKEANLDLLCPHVARYSFPAIPSGLQAPMACCDSQPYHRCEEHRRVNIPLVLVVNIRLQELIYDADGSGNSHLETLEADAPFDPYWLFDVNVIHDWVPYPPRLHRSLNVFEAACLLAQHPCFGSVQSHDEPRVWGHGRIQVYSYPDQNRIVADRLSISGHCHHLALTTGVFGLNSPNMGVHRVPMPREEPQTRAGGKEVEALRKLVQEALPTEPEEVFETDFELPDLKDPQLQVGPEFSDSASQVSLDFNGHVDPE